MWRRTALIIALGLTLAIAHEISRPGYRPFRIPHFRCKLGPFRCRYGTRLGDQQSIQTGTATDPSRSSLRCLRDISVVALDEGLISLHYCLKSDTRELTVRVVRRDNLQIESTRTEPDGTSQAIVYLQEPRGDILLSVQSADGPPCEYRSPSLWHLLLAHPAACEQHLVEVLKMLRPDWQVEIESALVRATLLQGLAESQATSRKEVELLVQQLADREYSIRQRADRELRSRGRFAICFLNDIDPSTLDSEQRLRIQCIQESMTFDIEDTPARVAAWLSNDKLIWVALLSDGDPQLRCKASSELARLCDRSIPFDPFASQAARDEQIAQLRSELLRR